MRSAFALLLVTLRLLLGLLLLPLGLRQLLDLAGVGGGSTATLPTTVLELRHYFHHAFLPEALRASEP